ncbi:superoxide dismutase [Fe] [Sphingopyxis lindanitolerans]|uniref:Superoxide dismutase n=1 Tax=Sphingopyxis lindanitolerans TaxID=2054227 RepID=A0A2S8B183_9SPHN|nr:superoxide dismutase [Sphingopyxis lindanitolerans]PQM26029.1 superoxide dismutase [Fe] [Sphingopyxis lindanitolerans]
MPFTLPPLPYATDAFGAVISAETFAYHHGKHHNAYVTKPNELVAADPSLQGKSLVELIHLAAAESRKPLFNQVGQIWNHGFYWLGLSPVASAPTGELLVLIERDFGSTADLVAALKSEAAGHFGSGWAALNLCDGRLQIASYHDADTPIAHGAVPLLIIDVWEHAYYIDYRNARPSYLDAILETAVNWDFVAANLDGQGASRADQPG